jgi:hypothetical protein
MTKTMPNQVKKYFWGDDLGQLNWNDHKKYIIQTLLDKGDSKSVSWLLKQAPKREILNILPSLKLSPRSYNFWKIYLA